ncbi:MAG: hypothetical protein OHK0056_24180 [Bacteriovoracaceae bacterium]
MKRISVFITSFLLSASAWANPSNVSQTEDFPNPKLGSRIQRVMVGLGQNSLGGDYAKSAEDGLGIDMYYGHRASYLYELIVNAHHFDMDNSDETRSLSMTSVNVSIKGSLYSFDSLDFFALGGLGLYWPKFEINGIEGPSKAVMGWTAGIGADLRLNSEFATGILGQYHDPFTQKSEEGGEFGGRYAKLMWSLSYFL